MPWTCPRDHLESPVAVVGTPLALPLSGHARPTLVCARALWEYLEHRAIPSSSGDSRVLVTPACLPACSDDKIKGRRETSFFLWNPFSLREAGTHRCNGCDMENAISVATTLLLMEVMRGRAESRPCFFFDRATPMDLQGRTSINILLQLAPNCYTLIEWLWLASRMKS